MRRVLLLLVALQAVLPAVRAQSAGATLRAQVREWREAHEGAIVRELSDLLAIPNNAADTPNIRRNADHLVDMLAQRGFRARLLEVAGSPPAVFGELRTPGATRTVVFYAHYDGQPVDSARWSSAPWHPVLRDKALFEGGTAIPLPAPGGRVDGEARLYARSASDDKAPIVALLAALDALRATGTSPSVNLKVFLEGEEEASSTHLRDMLQTHQDVLGADLWLFGDGPVHQSRQQQLVYGVRGVVGLNLTVFGPTRPLHSGHYGNWAPNPNVLLAHLIASMRSINGDITIDGFMDDVRSLTNAERAAFASIPAVDGQLRAELGLAATEHDNAFLAQRIALPALNVGGLSGGRAGDGGGANVIHPSASAYIDFRLVPNQQPARVAELVEAHIRKQGFTIVRGTPDSATRARFPHIVQVTWDGGYPATRTPLDHPAARAVATVARQTLGQVIEVPTLGGSLPLFHFQEVLHTPFVIVPIVNHDNNQHGEDENPRIQNLWDGIELYAGLVARLGTVWGPTP